MNAALVVFWKEIVENLRDKRTVLNTLLTGPLFAPLIFVLLINMMVSRELDKAEKPLPVPVAGAERAPNLIAALKRSGVEIKEAPADIARAVRENDADLVLVIPERYPDAWRKGETAEVELWYDQSQREAQGQVARLRGLLEQQSSQQGMLRLVARGLSPSVVRPIAIADRDQSTRESRSAMMFGMLPYFFILGLFIGGMALAIDTTAGERERQSLEPLFANPVPRSRLLLGKLAATSTFAYTSLAISILAFAVIGQFVPTEKLGMRLDLGPGFIGLTLLVMAPLAFLIATLQTLAAAFAKSFREAQTYLSLLTFVPVIPTMFLTLFPVKTKLWMYAVPLMGQQVTLLRLLRGEPVGNDALLLCVASTLAVGVLAYVVAVRIYNSERLAISG